MHIEFSGAAREVTGSCHILRVGSGSKRRTILLDCGLFQGKRSESRTKNARLPVPVSEIDAVILSHAHIDHAGRLPYLVAQGYKNTIWATAATRDLCAIMLADSAHIQEKDAEFLAKHRNEFIEPLYRVEDATNTLERMVGMPIHKWFDVTDGVRAMFTEAGHILGSASIALEVREGSEFRRVVFSGDVGRCNLPIIRDPQPPEQGADVILCESTYGNRDHESVEGAREQLAAVVRETAARGGRVLIPAFAVGRTQELVYDLHALRRDGKIPDIPIYIDSPLATDATAVFAMHPEAYDHNEELVRRTPNLFDFPMVKFTRDVSESKRLNTLHGPMIVIAASGMAESGRILHHLRFGAGDPRNTILVVGFMAEHTLGRRIVERRPVLRIFGDEVPLSAQVEVLNGYSAHADRTELLAWLRSVRQYGVADGRANPHVYLVHGERDAQDAFAEQLRGDGFTVSVPSPGDVAAL
ncbi:MAG: MBL fold metallo-hydrolase [Gemmatimonadaceae bacterium]|jgi:metallo-beta-lactamase family protein|uniref:MBL fold metallo-hydrolase RNA specificity domain-containing protein n=1 Tax=Gemmatimonas sp. TaxID=1962908 RepID=UPI001E0CBF4C|nr:MBL fold metallo-hydrolase [Gemmatimonas sp.]NCW44635.1 MBL fold metallo-hydrolase [Gemmatimonadaceae bacterium]